MKPVPAIIAPDTIFFVREIKQQYFCSEFHFHEECQLAYIIKGSGKRIVGDSIDHFEENELVFIGSNLPHVWYNTEKKTLHKKSLKSVSLSLFISPVKFLNLITDFGEADRVKKLFRTAQRGMFITGTTKLKLITLLEKAALEKNGMEHIITLFTIIHLLSTTREYNMLAKTNYINYFQYRENERMNNVYSFLMKNFKKQISLTEVAGIAAMNPNAFCRYFKSRTQKSLIRFINEVRIGHACKLLADENNSITQAAYGSGFNNISNFNLFFKAIKKITPGEYRKELFF